MKEKTPKVKKIREKKPRKKIKPSSMLFMGLSLVLTIGLFVGLVILQNVLAEDIVYQSVLVAKNDMPQNTIVTEENIAQYFTTKQVDILNLTEGTITDPEELVGQKSLVGLYKGEIVLPKDFEKISVYTENLKEPVEVSIQIEDVASADGGKLRAGDLINITMMFTKDQLGIVEESGTMGTVGVYVPLPTATPIPDVQEDSSAKDSETESSDTEQDSNKTEDVDFTQSMTSYDYEKLAQYVLENMYVSKALDSSGVEIESTDTETAASMLIFIIEKEMEANLNNALENCTSMRISKVLSKSKDALIEVEDGGKKEKGEQDPFGENSTGTESAEPGAEPTSEPALEPTTEPESTAEPESSTEPGTETEQDAEPTGIPAQSEGGEIQDADSITDGESAENDGVDTDEPSEAEQVSQNANASSGDSESAEDAGTADDTSKTEAQSDRKDFLSQTTLITGNENSGEE